MRILVSDVRSSYKLLLTKRIFAEEVSSFCVRQRSVSSTKGWLIPFFTLPPVSCKHHALVKDVTMASRRWGTYPAERLWRPRILAVAHGVRAASANIGPEQSLFQGIRSINGPSSLVRANARAASGGKQGEANKTKKPVRRRRRLDEICVERFPEHSRTLIQSWIMQGKVLVEGQPVWKSGASLPETANISIIAEVPKYVCRAGYKLEGALSHFAFDPSGLVALDSGLSTGGFTDCLLQNGAVRVYGVDVGYGQVSEKIRGDSRVVVMERTNLRHLGPFPELVDLVTLDLSFISILTVMPSVTAAMKPSASLITLIKPQFEARRGQVGSGGIVRDPKVHSEVLDRVIAGIQSHGFQCRGWTTSPIKGAEGNVEFLALFDRGAKSEDVLGDTLLTKSVDARDVVETHVSLM